MSDEMFEALRSLEYAVRHMSQGDPDDGPVLQASDVVRWAVAEIERLRAAQRCATCSGDGEVLAGMGLGVKTCPTCAGAGGAT